MMMGYGIFYLGTGFRIYYLTFWVFFVGILASMGITKLPRSHQWLAILIIGTFSISYSWKTMYVFEGDQTLLAGEFGRSSEMIAPLDLNRTHSLSIRTWLNVKGWKILRSEAEKLGRSKAIVVEKSLYDGAKIYWYLKIERVRRYLDVSYNPPHDIYEADKFYCDRDFILYSSYKKSFKECGQQLSPSRVIYSLSGEPVFSVFEPKKL
jgi:hypothetical protein